MTLRGVRARLVERIYFRQILRDGAVVELAETHLRYFLKTARLPTRGMANEDRSPNFVRAAAQSPQYFCGTGEIGRFSDHTAVERDERIRAQDNGAGCICATSTALRIALQAVASRMVSHAQETSSTTGRTTSNS